MTEFLNVKTAIDHNNQFMASLECFASLHKDLFNTKCTCPLDVLYYLTPLISVFFACFIIPFIIYVSTRDLRRTMEIDIENQNNEPLLTKPLNNKFYNMILRTDVISIIVLCIIVIMLLIGPAFIYSQVVYKKYTDCDLMSCNDY